MSSFSDRIYESLYITEGFVPTIYKDSKGIPTIGVGYALLINKGGKYELRDDIENFYENMGYSPEQKEAVKAALFAAQDALNGVSGAVNPFKFSSALLWESNHTEALNAEITKYGSVGTKQQFKTDYWDTNGSIFQEYFTKVKSFIGDLNWNQLTEDEQVALYSIYYNGAAGSKIKAAINLLTESGTKSTSNKNGLTDKQYIGYINFLYEIIYNSNKGNTESCQNRRFFEAKEALGSPLSCLPSDGNVYLTIPVNNLNQANIAIAFMNQNKDAMKNKLGSITNYKNNPYKYIRDNFSAAVSTFLSHQNYTGSYDINTLFTDWNLYTDLQINTSTGTTSYGHITGSDKRDLIFITGEQDGTTVHAGAGDDFVGGSAANDIVYSGRGDDVIYTYGGNDTVYTTDGKNSDYNVVYLGAGGDTFKGGDGDDYVDGGSGYIGSYGHSKDEATDSSSDVNNIDLGGGQNRYIGGIGTDKVQGTGYNKVYLGAGSDEYHGGNGIDIVDGGSLTSGYSSDGIHDKNTIYLGGGNDRYTGGLGKDIVHGGADDDYIYGDDGNDELYGDAGSDHLYGDSGNDELYGGTGIDYLYPGTGINKIDCGVDNNSDFVCIQNNAGGIDTIYHVNARDRLSCAGGFNISTLTQVGRDVVLYGNRGNKIVLKNVKLDDDGDPNGRIPCDSMPALYQPDGTVLQWNGTEYVDTGISWPSYEELPEDIENLPLIEDLLEGEEIPGTTNCPSLPADGTEKPITENPASVTAGNKKDLVDLKEGAENSRSPLVVDLDGDGTIETISTDGGIHFDFDSNQKIENSGWIGRNEGFLVRDLNGNGQIDNGTELFGNHTLLQNGKNAVNGFEALKDLDSNGDGVFDSEDEAWNEVKVWRDSNTNARVDEGELLTLEQAGIKSINLGYNYQKDADENGNIEIQQGTFNRTDGTSGKISDIWFDVDGTNTILNEDNISISEDIKALPNIKGWGNVYSLHAAMARDESGTLKSLVEQYLSSTDDAAKDSILTNIIYYWAEVQDMDPEGRNPSQVYGNVLGDARKLEALEEFMGEEYLGTWCWGEREPNPHGHAAPMILQAFDLLKNYVGTILSANLQNNPYLQNILLVYNAETRHWDVNVDQAVAMLQDAFDEDATKGKIEMLKLSNILRFYDNADDVLAAFQAKGNAEGTYFENELLNFGYNSVGSEANDNLFGTEGNDLMNGLGGNDIIKAGRGHDTILGGAGNDYMYGEAGDDILDGGEGNDYLFGGEGNDVLIGGAGNDILSGGEGDDIYLLEKGFGNDAIDNTQDNSTPNADIIQFGEGISTENTSLQRQGFDLIISIAYEDGTSDSVRVYSYFDNQGTSSTTVSAIQFADGTSWDYNYVINNWNSLPDVHGGKTLEGNALNNVLHGSEANDILAGNDGDDEIHGNGGNDLLYGGKGDDSLNGGYGNDTYLWNLGDGLDTIYDIGNLDTIKFGEGIVFDNLIFRNSGEHLVILVHGQEDQGLILQNFFYNQDYKIEKIQFFDGSSIDLSEIGLTLTQLNSGESIKGTEYSDIIYANGGNDTVHGDYGDDTIYGGAGFDTLHGNDGDDTLIGGKGNDSLNGGYGADTYVWNLGDGLDKIEDYQSGEEGQHDRIKFGEGITFGDLTFERDGYDLSIYVKGDKTQGLQVHHQFYNESYRIEYLEFADGTIFNLIENGYTFRQTDAHDNVSGTDFDDVIYGNGGNDIINAGYGDDILIGGKGNDSLNGGYGADTYVWNLGDGWDKIEDYQYGEEGQHDKIKFGAGISFEDLTFERDGYDLKIYVNGDRNQGLQVHHQFYEEASRIEYLEFADGTIFNLIENGYTFLQTDAHDNVSGTDFDDVIYGNGGNDTINTGYGDDILIGGKGNDQLNGGYGADTYVWNLGDGLDKIEDYQYGEEGQHDRIKFGEGISFENLTFERDGYDLKIYVNGDRNQGLQVHHQFYEEASRIEYLEFADGTVKDLTQMSFVFRQTDGDDNVSGTDLDDIIYGNGGNDTINAGDGDDTIYGGDGNDTINGGYGNDTIEGGKGNDRLDGGYGNDTFIYNLGDGFDVISDYGNEDKIILGEGIAFEDLSFERDGYHLNVYINGDRTQGFQLYNQFYSSEYAIEMLQFADGSSVNLREMGFTLNQNDYDETISGTDYDDVIYAKGGNDTINAGDGDDTIYGGEGNDTINGGYGDDTIEGGKGNDRLDGGYGNDTFIYNLGDGFDVISDYGNEDKIILGEGITFEDLSFEQDGYHLNVYINGDRTQGFQLYNQFYSGEYAIEMLQFTDGSTVNLRETGFTFNQNDYDEIISGTDYDDVIYGKGGNDTINAGYGDDTIYGGEGNDIINGGYGNDTIIGGKGNDRLDGGYGNDTFIYNLGDGFDTISASGSEDKIILGEGITFEDLSFERDGYHLNVYINGDRTQGFQLYNQFYGSEYAIEMLQFADGSTVNLRETGFTFNQNDYDEIISGTDYDDVIYGKGGNDTINAGYGNDTVIGGTGHDRLEGGAGNDTYLWNLGDGIDTISDSQGNNKIKFGSDINTDDLSFAQVGNSLRIIINNDPSQGLIIEKYYQDASYRIDTIEFADGSTASVAALMQDLVSLPNLTINGTDDDDILTGGDGFDTINAGDGYNDITGGKGNDILNGGYDKDTYYYNIGDGYDIISDPYGRDKIIFGEGISQEDIILQRDNYDLLISFKNNDNDSIRISYHFYDDDRRMEQLEFDDGSIMNLTKGLTLYGSDKSENISGTTYNDTIYGLNGNDTINGGAGADIIVGGKGNDTIDGGAGSDTYIWNLGDDLDTITASDIDKLQFGEGITLQDLSFRSEGNHLRILVNNDETQGIVLVNFFYTNDAKLNLVSFADGSTFDLATSGLTLDQHSSVHDTISGTSYDDVINAHNTYSVTINAGGGDDVINAGSGNDTINGGAGADIIVGGKGNDTIDGGAGSDTYIWNLGDDLDTITASDIDKLQFGEGITLQDLSFRSEGNHLRILVNNDETQGIVLVNFFYTNDAKLNLVSFADGSTFDLATSGLTLDQHSSAHDIISGTLYDDVINAQNTYSVTINAGYGNDVINAGSGNDTINAGDGNDIISGGKGNDILNGGSGNDTYLYNLGDGFDTINDNDGIDKIIFGEGITFEDLSFRQSGYSLIIMVNDDPNQGFEIINYYYNISSQIEELQFADGSIKLLPQIDITLQQDNRDETINGTNRNETIYGNGGNDIINGGYGNDIIIGGHGNDTLNGGGDDDTYIYNLGDGLDTVNDNAGQNIIVFGEGITQDDVKFTQNGDNLLIYLNDDKNQGIIINNFFYDDASKISELHFADNSVFYLSETGLTLDQSDRTDNMTVKGTDFDDTIIGGIGNDTINAGDDDDTLIGGKGNDTLNGGFGRDTYVYNLGDGMDIINETRGNDKIKFGAGITKDDLTFTQEGNNLRIIISNDINQSILINGFYENVNYQVESIVFADGSKFNLSTQGLTLQQTNADDNVNGTSYDDIIYGNGGHDTINTGEGNDTLIGGTGNDILNGGSGNDTYVYNLGDGFDIINESGGNDKIVFGEGISLDNLSFERIEDNLKISINGDEVKGIQINNQFNSASNKVETIEFDDGSTLDITNANQLIQALNSFSLSNSASTDTLSNPTQNVSEMYDLAANSNINKAV